MLQVVEQRPYIENFLEFVRTFLITESASIQEMTLVAQNLDILKDRITQISEKHIVIGPINL